MSWSRDESDERIAISDARIGHLIQPKSIEEPILKGTDSAMEIESQVPSTPVCDFSLLKLLGKRDYGKVYLARKNGGKDNGQLYAIKAQNKFNQEKINNINTERQVSNLPLESCPP